MVVGNSEIKALSLEERQMIYDALVHYMFSESEMGRSLRWRYRCVNRGQM